MEAVRRIRHGRVRLGMGMDEHVRVAEYHRRFPTPLQWRPPTDGWRKLMSKRERQLRRIQDMQQRWDGFMDLMQSGALVQNYTRRGFEVVQTPPEVQSQLQAVLEQKLRDAPHESMQSSTTLMMPVTPRFIHHGNEQLLTSLQPMHEVGDRSPSPARKLRATSRAPSLEQHMSSPHGTCCTSRRGAGRDCSQSLPTVCVYTGTGPRC